MKLFEQRNVLVSTALISAISPLAGVAADKSSAASELPQHPNILWISTEDCSQRWGCYGDDVAQTPTIDRLAAQGIRYDNAFTTAAISSPVRAGIITGMYQTSIGCHNMRTITYMRGEQITPYNGVPPHYVKAFTEYLRNGGYYCTNRVKTDYQFAAATTVPESIWDETSAEAHFKNRSDKSQPFFAVFNFEGTHEGRSFRNIPVETDINSVEVPPYYMDEPTTRTVIARHYDNIAAYDEYVANLLEELEADGELDNTIIFLWGDHGDGFARGKRWLYDSGTHIPLVVYIPGREGGEVSDRLISSIDFGPTVLSLAGVDVPTHMQGQPFLGSQDRGEREYIYAARDREDESYDMVRAVRDKRYLYIRNFYPNQPYVGYVPYRNGSPIIQDLYRAYAEDRLNEVQSLWFAKTRPAEELYDVESDPHNINNLAREAEYAPILKKMRELQSEWSAQTNDMGLRNEEDLYRQFFPNGEQCKTNRPYFVVNCEEEPVRRHKADENYTITSPALVDFYCSTQGASMVYKITAKGAEPNKHWSLYNGAVRVAKGSYDIEVKAQRYGYIESETLIFHLRVK
ncbi:MAG: sulfatase [Rikenellaceae bacterium]